MARINGADLLEKPQDDYEEEEVLEQPSEDGTPFNKGFDLLSTTSGDRLEIMTRTNEKIAKAGTIAYAHAQRFPESSRFILGLYEQTMRHAVSIMGKGRQEIAVTVQAFSGATAEYYNADAQKQKSEDDKTFIPIGKGDYDSP